ncbi:MAG: MATE family efflux transporter [bacterium]
MAFGIDKTRAKTISVLAAPIVIAMFTQTFINVVDTIFVGKLDPTYSIPGQAALGFSLPILWSIGGFLAAIGIGTQAMTARRLGANAPEEAGAVLTNSLIVAALSSIVFTWVGWAVIPYLFKFLTTNESVIGLGIPYARFRILGILPMVMTTSYKGFFDGLGSTRVHMYAAITMNLANIVLNYVFIFGAGPIPAYYVTGAAIASVISVFVGLGVMVIWSLRAKYRQPHRYYRPKTIRAGQMWEIVKLSVPSGAAQLFVMAGVLMFLKIIGILDERAVLAALGPSPLHSTSDWTAFQSGLRTLTDHSGLVFTSDWHYLVTSSRPPIYTTAAKLIIDLLSIGFVMCIAFGTAAATLVSRSMGEKRYDLAEAYGWDAVRIGSYVFGVIGLVIILQPAFFLDLLSDDAAVIHAAIPGLRIMAALEVFIAMALILTQALFGAGNTKFVMYVELLLHITCLAPLTYVFGVIFDLGFLGVWLSATVYVLALASAMAWKFWEGSWKRIEV